MPSSDLAQYKPLFLQTAWDYVRQLESALTQLLSDPENAEAVASSYISAHSLKSQSSVMGYAHLAESCRNVELVFRFVKEDKITLNEEDLYTLQTVLEAIKKSLAVVSAGDEDVTMENEVEKLLPIIAKGGSSE